jgi:beta-phosphoglucomutase-like phosphatase (HAD superfamily)
MRGMVVKAILWDMDGTFVDSEPLHHAALARAMTAAGFPISVAQAGSYIGIPMVGIHARLVEDTGITLSYPDLAERTYAAYLEVAPALKRRPGAGEAWVTLAAAGMRQAVVSNADRIILQANLQAAGLARPGLVSIAINDVTHGKPEPEPYLRAAHLLGVAPAECLVVEDTTIGAAAGCAAGMQVVAWPQPGHGQEAFPSGANVFTGADLTSHLLRCVRSR